MRGPASSQLPSAALLIACSLSQAAAFLPGACFHPLQLPSTALAAATRAATPHRILPAPGLRTHHMVANSISSATPQEKEVPPGPWPRPRLPCISAPIGSLPLFPGSTRTFNEPTPGQAAAVRVAVAFAAADDRFGGTPVVLLLRGGTGEAEAVRGVGSLAAISEWDADDNGNFRRAPLLRPSTPEAPMLASPAQACAQPLSLRCSRAPGARRTGSLRTRRRRRRR